MRGVTVEPLRARAVTSNSARGTALELAWQPAAHWRGANGAIPASLADPQ